MPKFSSCPCGSPLSFENCCLPFLEGHSYPDTAEKLMRSRYSAFVSEDESYLLNTWFSKTRPASIDFEQNTKWLGLKIIKTEKGLIDDNAGSVHFIARYKIAGKAFRIDEDSLFEKIKNKWLYLGSK